MKEALSSPGNAFSFVKRATPPAGADGEYQRNCLECGDSAVTAPKGEKRQRDQFEVLFGER